MIKFLQEVMKEIAGVKPRQFELSKVKVKKGEEVILVLPDDLKAFFTVMHGRWVALTKRCEELHPRMEKLKDKAINNPEALTKEDMEFNKAHSIDHERAKLLKKMFWRAVEELVPARYGSKPKLALRKGWKVVIMPS